MLRLQYTQWMLACLSTLAILMHLPTLLILDLFPKIGAISLIKHQSIAMVATVATVAATVATVAMADMAAATVAMADMVLLATTLKVRYSEDFQTVSPKNNNLLGEC